MKITKYPQSCMVIEKGSARLVVDPGTVAMDRHRLDDFGDFQAVLYTHRHADHLDERQIDALLQRGAELYGNADVCAVLGDAGREVRDGEELEIAGFRVTPRDLPHFPMVNGSAGPPNSGFVFDDRLFHPGDGISMEGLDVDVLAVPIAGPSTSFRDAYVFAQQVRAKRLVPIHYDIFVADPHLFAKYCDIATVIALDPGETAEI